MAVSKSRLTERKLLESSNREDLESLLKLAEELKDKSEVAEAEIEGIRNRGLVVTFVVILAIFAMGLSLILIRVDMSEKVLEQPFVVIAIVTTIIGILLEIFISYYLYSRRVGGYRKKIFLDKLALKEILQLLRETSEITANRENWSIISRAEFRIRLSRFNFEESTSQDSMFDSFLDTVFEVFLPFKKRKN